MLNPVLSLNFAEFLEFFLIKKAGLEKKQLTLNDLNNGNI